MMMAASCWLRWVLWGVGQAGLLGDHDGVVEVAYDGVVELGDDQASLLVELVLALLLGGAGLEAVMTDDLTDYHTRDTHHYRPCEPVDPVRGGVEDMEKG